VRRRDFLQAGIAAAGAVQLGCSVDDDLPSGPVGKSAVAILKAASYTADLAELMRRGAALCGLNAKGKRVLLKPNLVEFASTAAINTHVAVVAAAVELFRSLGAAEVIIGEGPGHRRDTMGLAEEAEYRRGIEKFDSLFVDLNRDDVTAVRGFADLPQIYLPNTALQADLIVSLAKMKTHHWAGGYPFNEELLRGGARRCLRLAEEPASPGWDRSLDLRVAPAAPTQLRYRGWHCRDGGQWADPGNSQIERPAGDGKRPCRGGCNLL